MSDIDLTYKNIPEAILAEFEKNSLAHAAVKNYRAASSERMKAIYGHKLFENYGNNSIWLMWYQSGQATKAYMAQIGAKGGKIGGAKSKGGGRPPKADADPKRRERYLKSKQKKD